MGATSTGTPKRVRRVKRDFVVCPTFLHGRCELCHVRDQLLSEVRLPDHHRYYQWWVVCPLCLELDPRLLAARAVIRSALSSGVTA